MEKIKDNRIFFLDVLNVLAIISVVALHMNGIVHTYSPDRSWATSLVMECVFYYAVPVFFMITGANLLNYRQKYDTKTYFKKRFIKVLIPAMFWILFVVVWKTKMGWLEVKSIKDFFNIIFSNQEETTYYFIWEILGVYLTIPIISLIINERKDSTKTMWYFVIVFFIFNSLLPFCFSLAGISYNGAFSLRIGEYFIFVVLGYLLLKTDIKKRDRIIIYVLGFLCIVFRYFMTYYFSRKSGVLITTTWGYTRPHSIILAVSVFVFFKYLNYNGISDNIKKIFITLSRCSYGIYLIHLIIKYYETDLFNLNIYSWEYRTFGILLTYFISLLIVYIFKKIPILKRIV